MKIYLNENVYEAALKRINFLFDEFENVVCCVSGGKDSTVVYNLVMKVAKERGRLPLTVFFFDQEAEWNETIRQVRKIMYSKDVKPMWLQISFKMENAASNIDEYLQCWDENKKDKWLREKEPIALTENKYKIDWWKDVFKKVIAVEYKGQKVCTISGVRAEESPKRFIGLTHFETYKGETWGVKMNQKDQRFLSIRFTIGVILMFGKRFTITSGSTIKSTTTSTCTESSYKKCVYLVSTICTRFEHCFTCRKLTLSCMKN